MTESKNGKWILKFNKIYLSILGLWPESPNNLLFTILFMYYGYCLFLIYLTFYLALGNFRKVLRSISEIITFTQVLYRLITLRRFNREFGEILDDMQSDFKLRSEKTDEERRVISNYFGLCKLFSLILVTFLGTTVVMYFLKPLIIQVSPRIFHHGKSHEAFKYELPQGFYNVFEVNSMLRYIMAYLMQLPFAMINNFAQSATDCLTLTIIYHLCGQLFVLSSGIRRLDYRSQTDKNSIRRYIKIHKKLLGIGTSIQRSFQSCFLIHLVGVSLLICILVYNVLMSIARGYTMVLLTFFVYGFLNILRFYSHCLVGEFLIYESLKVYQAFYEFNWLSFPIGERKHLIICIKRAQKPLYLMAGKFGSISLSSFVEVLKTALAYLSVLRSVV